LRSSRCPDHSYDEVVDATNGDETGLTEVLILSLGLSVVVAKDVGCEIKSKAANLRVMLALPLVPFDAIELFEHLFYSATSVLVKNDA
ncbi:MAG TPA: hypothetical protein VIK27_08440, partial [Candidatus Aquilonibacter sp.]